MRSVRGASAKVVFEQKPTVNKGASHADTKEQAKQRPCGKLCLTFLKGIEELKCDQEGTLQDFRSLLSFRGSREAGEKDGFHF